MDARESLDIEVACRESDWSSSDEKMYRPGYLPGAKFLFGMLQRGAWREASGGPDFEDRRQRRLLQGPSALVLCCFQW